MARDQQGRGRGRFTHGQGSPGGRGGGRRTQTNSQRSNTTPNKPLELKFGPLVQGKALTASYATVKEAIVLHIQKSYVDGNDVAQSLEHEGLIDLETEEPERKLSAKEDAEAARIEQTGFDMKYQEALRGFSGRTDNLRRNMLRAYALIFNDYCNPTMKSRLEQQSNFESEIKNHPIKLLEVIKILMHAPIRATYPMIPMTDALIRLVNVKQMDQELVADYIKRFKQLRDVAKSHLGTAVLDQYVEHSAEYMELDPDPGEDLAAKKKLKNAAYDTWMAYL